MPRKEMPWFRFYTEALHDPKLRRLDVAHPAASPRPNATTHHRHQQGAPMAENPTAEESIQLLPALDLATEAALRESIRRFGVFVPVVEDQNGRLIDGHHRSRIANELGVPYDTRVVHIADEDEAVEVMRTLNMDRRHLGVEERRQMVAFLRGQGHSLRSIAGALGVSKSQVANDAEVSTTGHLDSVRGSDGKTYPAHRRAHQAADEHPELEPHLELLEHAIDDATTDTDTELQDEAADTAVDVIREHLHDEADDTDDTEPSDDEPTPREPRSLPKPDLGGGVSHPARYSRALYPVFARQLATYSPGPQVLDPFAGVGGIHDIAEDGWDTTGVEIEPDYANKHPRTLIGDATSLPFPDDSFDAIVTSPTYGNRLADNYDAADPGARRSYRFDLGHELHDRNTGAMQWGPQYRTLHAQAWAEAVRVLRPGGVFVLNIKDHIRGGGRQHVAGWHATTLCRLGLDILEVEEVGTPSLRQGANADLRLVEQVWTLHKPTDTP